MQKSDSTDAQYHESLKQKNPISPHVFPKPAKHRPAPSPAEAKPYLKKIRT